MNVISLFRRVLRRLDLELSDDVIRALANTTNPKPRVIEKVLMLLRTQIDKMLERQGRSRREIDMQTLAMDKDSNKDSSKFSNTYPFPSMLWFSWICYLTLHFCCVYTLVSSFTHLWTVVYSYFMPVRETVKLLSRGAGEDWGTVSRAPTENSWLFH